MNINGQQNERSIAKLADESNRLLFVADWVKGVEAMIKPRSATEIAREHQEADRAQGRDWNGPDGCGCGACNSERKRSALGEVRSRGLERSNEAQAASARR